MVKRTTIPLDKDMCVLISLYNSDTAREPVIDFPIMFLFQITVTPLGALTNADIDSHDYFEDWLPGAAECTSAV